MVHFTNIVIKDGYIEADVWNESNMDSFICIITLMW